MPSPARSSPNTALPTASSTDWGIRWGARCTAGVSTWTVTKTHDHRQLVPGTLVTIEPGIYGPEIGVRSEINVVVQDGKN
jgi:Xaa-Pro aminopeptidase